MADDTDYHGPDRLSEHRVASMLAGLELHRALADSQAMLMALIEHDEELADAEIRITAGDRVVVSLVMREVLNANSAAIAMARRNLNED